MSETKGAENETKVGEGRARWWLLMCSFFLALELAFRLKLGTVYVLAVATVWVQQALEAEGVRGEAEPGGAAPLLFAFFSGTVICAVVFAGLSVLNIIARTINPDFMWFQLP